MIFNKKIEAKVTYTDLLIPERTCHFRQCQPNKLILLLLISRKYPVAYLTCCRVSHLNVLVVFFYLTHFPDVSLSHLGDNVHLIS